LLKLKFYCIFCSEVLIFDFFLETVIGQVMKPGSHLLVKIVPQFTATSAGCR